MNDHGTQKTGHAKRFLGNFGFLGSDEFGSVSRGSVGNADALHQRVEAGVVVQAGKVIVRFESD